MVMLSLLSSTTSETCFWESLAHVQGGKKQEKKHQEGTLCCACPEQLQGVKGGWLLLQPELQDGTHLLKVAFLIKSPLSPPHLSLLRASSTTGRGLGALFLAQHPLPAPRNGHFLSRGCGKLSYSSATGSLHGRSDTSYLPD